MSIMFSGAGVQVYTATVLKNGIALYARTGLRPNRAYTPKAMMAQAALITGRTFRARDYAAAVAALQEWIDRAVPTLPAGAITSV